MQVLFIFAVCCWVVQLFGKGNRILLYLVRGLWFLCFPSSMFYVCWCYWNYFLQVWYQFYILFFFYSSLEFIGGGFRSTYHIVQFVINLPKGVRHCSMSYGGFYLRINGSCLVVFNFATFRIVMKINNIHKQIRKHHWNSKLLQLLLS